MFCSCTVSDRCSKGILEDKSGHLLQSLATEGSLTARLIAYEIVPDDVIQIGSKLRSFADGNTIDIVLVTGGTGFAPRDVTPEAVRLVMDKECSGLTSALLNASLERTPMAALSRLVCAIRKQTLIISLPGSVKAVSECFPVLERVLPHAVALLRDDRESEAAAHYHHRHHHHYPHDQPKCSLLVSSPSEQQSTKQSARTLESTTTVGTYPTDQRLVVDNVPVNATAGQAKLESDVGEAVARRARKSPFPMIAVADAYAIITQCADQLFEKTEPARRTGISLLESVDLVVCDDQLSTVDLPPFACSIKDGYAVIASDGSGPRLVMSVGSDAGLPAENLETLKSGFCTRINTGAPIPSGADAVIQVEDTRLLRSTDDGREELEILITEAPTSGQDIRPAGCDMCKGDLLLQAGSEVAAADVAVLASAGIGQLTCYRRPTVAILSNGNELSEAGSPLAAGRIYDANRPALFALLKKFGFTHIVDLGTANDTVQDISQKVETALANGDIDCVISTGGQSMGDKDLFRQVLCSKFGASLKFARVNMKPGKPTSLCVLARPNGSAPLLWFGLPGNPVSAAVTFHVFVLPALQRLAGRRDATAATTLLKLNVRLAHEVVLDPRPEYQRAVLINDEDPSNLNDVPLASVTGVQRSSRVLSLHGAEVLLELPACTTDRTLLKKGDLVAALQL